jgi:serine/threonine protein kinase
MTQRSPVRQQARETLGRSRASTVFRVRHDNKVLVRKVYDLLHQDKLEAEVEALERVGTKAHPNVVPFLRRANMTLELASQEGNLATRLKARRSTVAECMQWKKQLGEGLTFLHQNCVLHGDIRPENILLGAGDRLMFCDFGQAVVLAAPPEKLTEGPLMEALHVGDAGALAYRAPEVLLGATRYAYEVDIWAVGCVLLEMMSGSNPFALPGEEKNARGSSPAAERQLRQIWSTINIDDLEYFPLPLWKCWGKGLREIQDRLPPPPAQPDARPVFSPLDWVFVMEYCFNSGVPALALRCLAAPSERPFARQL